MLLSLKKKKQTRTGGAGGAAGARRVDPGLLRVTKGTVLCAMHCPLFYIYIYIFFQGFWNNFTFHNLASCRNFIHNVAVNALLGWSTASVENVCGWLQTVCVMFSRRCGYLDKY